MTQWEYKLVDLRDADDSEEIQNMLNELGSDGWEVVGNAGYTKLDAIILKRPRG